MVGTLPGRTQGLGLITEPLLADLRLDRVSYATLNFWATIIGSAGAIGVGRLIDRYGGQTVLTAVAIALGIVVAAMSQVTAMAALAVCVTLTRGFGQSALSVVSLTLIGKSIRVQLDRAMAIYSVVMSIGFMIAFPAVGALVQARGWRVAWFVVGLAVLALVAPAAGLLPKRLTASSGSTGSSGSRGSSGAGHDATLGAALRTGAFWVFAIGAALYGLVASGIGLFNESVLAERGFGPEVYYQTLVVTALTGLGGNFLGGWLAQRVRLTSLLATSLATLAAGLIALPHLTTITHVMLWAVAMGLGGGFVMVLFFSVWPRIFGQAHLGRIQGAAQALTVFASALGPLLLAWCVDWTGSYTTMFRILAAVIAATALSALAVRLR